MCITNIYKLRASCRSCSLYYMSQGILSLTIDLYLDERELDLKSSYCQDIWIKEFRQQPKLAVWKVHITYERKDQLKIYPPSC